MNRQWSRFTPCISNCGALCLVVVNVALEMSLSEYKPYIFWRPQYSDASSFWEVIQSATQTRRWRNLFILEIRKKNLNIFYLVLTTSQLSKVVTTLESRVKEKRKRRQKFCLQNLNIRWQNHLRVRKVRPNTSNFSLTLLFAAYYEVPTPQQTT